MLRSVKSLIGYRIGAKDDEIGRVQEFLFDSFSWIIRYLVLDTGTWLPGRNVLISPVALGQPNWEGQLLPVELTREQVKNSPDIDLDKPVSRQCEIELHKHYNWTPYWAGGGFGFAAPVVQPTGKEKVHAEKQAKAKVDLDPQLRSTQEVIGYNINAADGDIGHVEDFILEDENWVIRYMVIDTRNWLPGRNVLISPQWVERISWPETKVYVDLLKETIKESPRYDPTTPVNREYETRLYDFYGRPEYWS